MGFKFGVKLVQKVLGQWDNVLFAFPKGRNLQVDDIQTIVEIGTKFVGIDHLFQVAVGGSNDPDVNFAGLAGTKTHDLILLEGTQKLHLDIHRHFTDLIKKQSAAIGNLKIAGAAFGQGTGEGAALVTEEFAFNQVFGNGTAVHAQHRIISSGAVLVDKMSQKLLAGACFTLDQHSSIFVGYFGGTIKNFVHFRIIDQKLGTVNVLLRQRTDFLLIFGDLNHLFA